MVRLLPGQLPTAESQPPGEPTGTDPGRQRPAPRRPRRRWIPRWIKVTAVLVVAGLIFRRAVASVVLIALSAMLHAVGLNVHLPDVRLGWPWQSVTAGTTSNVELGPWVLQKVEGISRPALGRASFSFIFTHKVSKSLGLFPCWYSSTFDAVAYASASVDLNPGPNWWARSSGHYRLQVLSRPAGGGKQGAAAVSMTLPPPQLPQSVHDVTIDNIPSKPVSTEHSWTYPGVACGLLIRPQFAQSVLYAQAQQIAFYKAVHSPQVTQPLIAAAEHEASQTIRDNFIQPTVNAFGYSLTRFTLHWAPRA
ncbi:MAG TPA: hypothetical protein VGM53_07515 [Streptosporangiaceae bacterium]